MDLKDLFGTRKFWNSRGVGFSKRESNHRPFTHSYSTKAKRKAKRKMSKASRKRNRRSR